MTPIARVVVGAAISALMLTNGAEAACTVEAAANASFGAGSTSFVVRDTTLQASTTSAGLTCGGAILSVLGTGDHVYVTVASANGGLEGPTGDIVPFAIYGDSTTAYPIPVGVQFDYASGQLLNLLGLFSGPATSLPMFFRTAPGANVAAGTYTDTITVNWSWDYCSGIGALGVCLGRDIGSGQATFTVTLVVLNTCQITSTPDVSFGSAATASGFADVAQQVAVLCTKGLLAFSVGIDAGQNPSGGVRRMAGPTAYLDYDVFKGASNQTWGATGGDRVAPPVSADGETPQPFSYTVRILPQVTPPVGVYQDMLIVDVAY